MPRPISPAASIERLRKEARRWLKALHAGDPEAHTRLERVWADAPRRPGLREVQHALARELGRASWAEVKQSLKDRPAAAWRSLTAEDYAILAVDLVSAHDGRNQAALARLNAAFGRSLALEDLDAEIWRRNYAYRQRYSRTKAYSLPLEEAQLLVAQDLGFGSWEQLMEALAGDARPAPPFLVRGQAVAPIRRLGAGDWDRLLDALRTQKLAKLEANGMMTDALLARVAELGHVTELNLSGSRELTDEGLRQLERMPQLERLDLSGAGVTDRGLEVLARLPNLKALEMCWQRGVTDRGVAHLAACQDLEHLNVMGTLTGDGVIAALRGKPRFRNLFTGRQVTDAGLVMLHDYPRFTAWSGEPADRDSDDIAGTSAHLHIDGPFTDRGVAGLAGLAGIYELNLFWNAKAITAKAFAHLRDLPNLGALGCDGALVDDEAMAHVGSLPKLRRFRAQENAATDQGFAALARSATLEALWTRDAGPGDRGFIALSQAPSLRRLGVSLARVGDEALSTLPAFPALREITPIGLGDEGFRHVGRCEDLRRLVCMYCRDSTDAATAYVADLALRQYYAGLTRITDKSLEILGRMTSLEIVELYETLGVTDRGLAHLARLPNLRRASFDHLPKVTPKGVAQFASAVEVGYSP